MEGLGSDEQEKEVSLLRGREIIWYIAWMNNENKGKWMVEGGEVVQWKMPLGKTGGKYHVQE
jgi:hypothetical protein